MRRQFIAAMVGVCGLLLGPGLSGQAAAEPLSVVSWNVENWGESDSGTIAAQLRDEFDAIDVFGLSEITERNEFALYARYAGEDEESAYKVVAGTTGANTKLGIVYRVDRLELLGSYELLDMMGTVPEGSKPTGRAPLVAHFRLQSGSELLFAVNHFHRGDAKRRKEQAVLFATWAGEQSLPIIAVGDYNFDFDVVKQSGNEAYDAFLDVGSFRWIEPEFLVTTNYSDRNNDQVNDYNSILDFVFVANADWLAQSEVIVRPGDFPDNEYTSDHRPVIAYFETDPSASLSLQSKVLGSDPPDLDAAFLATGPQPRLNSLSDRGFAEAMSRFEADQATLGDAAEAVGMGSTPADLLQRIDALSGMLESLRQDIEQLE